VTAYPSPPGWTLSGIAIDTAGWRIQSSAPASIAWSGDDGSKIELHVAAGENVNEPDDIGVLRDHLRQVTAARGMGLVSADRYRTSELTVVEVIAKRRAGLGYAYEGHLGIRCADSGWALEVLADEGGFTGVREALVTAVLVPSHGLQLEPETAPGGPRRMRGWFFDPYDAAFDAEAVNAISDDARIDEVMESHSLSRVRAILRRTRRSLVLEVPGTGATSRATLADTPADGPPPRTLLPSDVVEALLASVDDARARHAAARAQEAREHLQTGIGILVVAVLMSALTLWMTGKWNVLIAAAFVWGGMRLVKGLQLRKANEGDERAIESRG
jgi:hypothetical protein